MRLDRSVLESLGTDFERVVAQDLRIRYPESKILHNLSFYSAFLGKETQNDILFLLNVKIGLAILRVHIMMRSGLVVPGLILL